MKIKLAEWASIAEILGAVAIVISLLFVGFQISDGTRETRAATVHASLDTEMFFQAEVMRYAGPWHRILAGEPLADGEEAQRGAALYTMYMTQQENRFQQANSGYLSEPPKFGLALITPFYDIWRGSGGALGRSPEFLEWLDNQRHQRLAE